MSDRKQPATPARIAAGAIKPLPGINPPPTRFCAVCGESVAFPINDQTASELHAHAATKHPATLPSKLTVAQMLALIPTLAAEAALTAYAPNPDGEQAHTQHTLVTSAPANLGVLDAFAPADERHTARPLTRLVECSRIVWETLDADLRAAHPQPIGEPTFTTEATWLANTWPDAMPRLDLADVDWIDDNLQAITRQLAALAHVRPASRYRCPDCGDSMQLGAGDWMICDSGAHQHPGPARLVTQWRRRPPMSTQALAVELRISPERIWKWRQRGKIAPAHTEGRTAFWLPWDVVRQLYPDVAKAIETREAEALA